MSEKIFNVLFLCRGNSARSIMAEAILEREGTGRFKAYSAGSHPRGEVHPYAADLLQKFNHPVDRLRSKNWDEFSSDDAPKMDFVFTVCDQTANEVCPTWPGKPMTAHWGCTDPVAVEGTEAEIRAGFADVYGQLANRISVFVNLPLAALDRLSLQRRLDEMGGKAKEMV
ncbi:arsenate reductase ArsC [Pacificispira sp.]|uniref:arsenate reductase ArsC n=1 Tax=Pacificispira sp. TaxID=2888761 RepID=UPI003BAC065F